MTIIFNEDIPSIVPLTSEQKAQLKPSGILPSGESNFYDYSQKMPETSGVSNPDESGIFHYNELVSSFSNVSEVSGLKANDFEIFNNYIHYYPKPEDQSPVKIPYVSTYKVSILFDPYTPRNL